jgi:hypothetical protein
VNWRDAGPHHTVGDGKVQELARTNDRERKFCKIEGGRMFLATQEICPIKGE